MTHASDHHYGLTAAEQRVLEGRREALARLVDPGSTWAQHPRCTCGPDQSGEVPDERPDCPAHGSHRLTQPEGLAQELEEAGTWDPGQHKLIQPEPGPGSPAPTEALDVIRHPLRTKSGRVITEEDIAAWADEAQAGYCTACWRPVHEVPCQ
jgi:hypothetical protein